METKRNGIETICITSETPHTLSSLLSFCSCLLTHRLTTLSLVILIDGLQAPDISGEDDLHHQISHQSYESKNEFNPPCDCLYLCERYSLYFCNEILAEPLWSWSCARLFSLSPALQTCGPDCGEVYQKGEPRRLNSTSSLLIKTVINSNLVSHSAFFQCKPEYKVAGLYVVDSIVRQSRHQFGADKDVFGPRFTKNIMGTFENLCLCPVEDRVRTDSELVAL